MPSLTWIGKDAVLNHHLDVPYRVLEKKYDFGDGEPGNKIIHGDNLEALKSLLPEYEGRVKCIYIDPPYNTGAKKEDGGWIYSDNVDSPKLRKWIGELVGKDTEDMTRHDKWLCMMYPRLKLLHKLLKNDGAIFISIDDNEIANLKVVCDEIFGSLNFVGQWNWFRSATPPALSHKIKKNVEYILCYEKKKNSTKYFGVQKTSDSDDPITKKQNSLKELVFPPYSIHFKQKDCDVKPGVYGTEKYPNELLTTLHIRNNMNENEVSFRNRFTWTQDYLNSELAKNTRINCSKQLVLSYKKSSYNPEVPPNFIDDCVGVDTTEEAGKLLSQIFKRDDVFTFPKPPSLIEYLINFLCDKSSIILDSFAGSGTTAHAVLNLNKQDGGNRKFILVEMEGYAETITAERVRRVINGYGEGKNAVEGTSGSFAYYELGPELLKDGFINEDVPEQTIREYLYYTETNHALPQSNNGHPAHLGNFEGIAYYFLYNKDETTTLDATFLASISEKADRYVIYADNCIMPQKFLFDHDITFKKIPRDIRRF